MHRCFEVLALIVTLVSLAQSSRAATLGLGVSADGYYTPNFFKVFGGGVSASDGLDPIVPIGYDPYNPLPPSIPASGGSMSLDYIGAGDQVEVRFDVSIFSDSDPFIQTGTWGPSGIPVTLRVDEISFELPAVGAPAAIAGLGSSVLNGLSATGTIRGSLTVGAETAPFTETLTGCCASADGAPGGGLYFNVYAPNSVVVGFGGGPGLLASPGVDAPRTSLTVDGVTFTTGVFVATFYTLTYVPEPGAVVLLALAVLCLGGMRGRPRSTEPQ